MDRFLSSNIEQQSIYDIYRACRLCGAGAGYKMPIIQNVVDLDGREVELKQKIQECVQIEVNQNDKMPPLICELCVDKVNDFYEFLEMCRQTNKRTRLRLGLPPQSLPSGAPDAGDCILGVTEPVFIKEEPDKPVTKHSSKPYKGKSKGSTNKIKIRPLDSHRSSPPRKSSPPSCKRLTRHSISSLQDTKSKANSHNQPKNSEHQDKKVSAPLKSILKKGIKVEEDSLLIPRSKRTREKDTLKESLPKRVKIELRPARRSSPRPTQQPERELNSHPCSVCEKAFKSAISLAIHSRVHGGLSRTKQSVVKHKTSTETPKVVKKVKTSDTYTKTAECSECGAFISKRNLRRHEGVCRRRGVSLKNLIIDPEVREKLREVQVRVARCDALLTAQDSCTTYNIPREYGLDTTCVYPYISSVRSLRIKTEPDADGMVSIDDRIRDEFGSEEIFTHWDSDYSSDDEDSSVTSPPAKKRKIDNLTVLTLKTIFSDKCLGKVPKRRRRVKIESLPDNETGATNLIESFEDIDDLERMNDNINDKVANFDDLLLNDDGFGERQLDHTDAVIEVHHLDEDSGNIEENVSIDTGEVAEESLETENKHNDECRSVLSNNDGTDTEEKFYSGAETPVETRNYLDSEGTNVEENNISKINNLKESMNMSSDIELEKTLEDDLLNDEDITLIAEDINMGNCEVEKELELNSETEDSVKGDYEIVQPEVNTEVTYKEVNGECNTGTQLSNTEDPAKLDQKSHKENQKVETEVNTEEEIERSNEEMEEFNIESKEGTKDSDKVENESEEDKNCGNGKTNIEYVNLNRGRIQKTEDVSIEADGDEKIDEHSEVTNNGLGNNGDEPKNSSANVNVIDYKTDHHPNKQKPAHKLDVDDLDYISDTELDDCQLMEALDAQIGEERSSKAEKDKITLEDLLPDKGHDIKPMDMEMLSDQFSFDA